MNVKCKIRDFFLNDGIYICLLKIIRKRIIECWFKMEGEFCGNDKICSFGENLSIEKYYYFRLNASRHIGKYRHVRRILFIQIFEVYTKPVFISSPIFKILYKNCISCLILLESFKKKSVWSNITPLFASPQKCEKSIVINFIDCDKSSFQTGI